MRRSVRRTVVVTVDSESSSDDNVPEVKRLRQRWSHSMATACGISSKEFRKLMRWGVPMAFFQLLCFAQFCDGWEPLETQCVEWMCGVGVIEQASLDACRNALGYDRRTRDSRMNILKCEGLMIAIKYARGFVFRSLHWWGILCSSWVWISRSVSERSCIAPEGDQDHWFAAEGNKMVSLMVLISLYILSEFGVVLVEQPISSLMAHHHRWNYLEKAAKDINMLMAMYEALTAIGGELEDLERLENPKGLVCVPTSMGCFGAQHAKRTLLWCTQPEVAYPLHKTLSKAQHKQLTGTATTEERLVVENDLLVRKVTGNKAVLKNTQEYPAPLGVAVRESYDDWLRVHPDMPWLDSSSESDYSESGDAWEDAGLSAVLVELRELHPDAANLR